MSRPASAAWYRCQMSVFSFSGKRLETVGVDLHDRRFVDALEQVGPLDRRRGPPRRVAVAFDIVAASARGGPDIVMTAIILFRRTTVQSSAGLLA